MSKMIVIGPERLRLPFQSIGFDMVEADAAGFIEALRKALTEKGVGLVVCGESFVLQVVDQFRDLIKNARSPVLVVPDGAETQGVGRELIRAAIERSAGVDLLGALEPWPTGEGTG